MASEKEIEGINVLPATPPEDDTKKQPADAWKISFDYPSVEWGSHYHWNIMPSSALRFLMSSKRKCGLSGINVLWERTAGQFTRHYPKTLLLSGDRLVGEEDAR